MKVVMQRLLYIGVLLFPMLIVGCAIRGIDQFSQEFTVQLENTINLSLDAAVYYHIKHKWPNDINELQTFCAEPNQPCIEANWHAFADANFQTLPDGNLMVEIKQRTTGEQFSDTGTITLTVPVPALSDEPNQDINNTVNAFAILRNALNDGNDKNSHK